MYLLELQLSWLSWQYCYALQHSRASDIFVAYEMFSNPILQTKVEVKS